MELFAAGVQDVGGLRRGLGVLRRGLIPLGPALPGGVVDGDAGLDVVDVHVEAHALPVVLHAEGLHQHAAGHQIVPLKDGGHPVEHVVVRLLHVVGHQVLKRQHAVHVHVPGAGDQVALVGVLAGELEADQVAAVIEVLAVVLHIDPAGGGHRADALPVLGGHQLRPHAGPGRAAAAQPVQLAVGLKGLGGVLVLGEKGLVAVDGHIGLADIGGNLVQIVAGGGHHGLLTAGEEQDEQEQQRQDSFHRW